MSEKIVQLNEEVIKGQLKELVRGSTNISTAIRYQAILPPRQPYPKPHETQALQYICFPRCSYPTADTSAAPRGHLSKCLSNPAYPEQIPVSLLYVKRLLSEFQDELLLSGCGKGYAGHRNP